MDLKYSLREPLLDECLENGQQNSCSERREGSEGCSSISQEDGVTKGKWKQCALLGAGLSGGILIAYSLITLAFMFPKDVHSYFGMVSWQTAPVRFLNIGDWGRGGKYNQSLLATQMGVIGERMGSQFVISNGDNFYDVGLKNAHDPFFAESFTNVYTALSLQTPWYSVLGNHDYYGNVLAQLNNHLANVDPRWSCVRSGTFSKNLCGLRKGGKCTDTVQFFLFDTVPMVKSYRGVQDNSHHVLDWRGINTSDWAAYNANQVKELTQNLEASNARWKVVIGHHPIYSYGEHGDTIELIEELKPVLEKYGVDAYVNGHDHDMQHIKREDSSISYFTSGGGSKAFQHEPPLKSNGLQFYWEGQGFAAFSIHKKYLKVEYYGVFGNLMYSTTLCKP